MTAAVLELGALAWLAVGLLALATPARLPPIVARRRAAVWGARAAAVVAFAVGAWRLAPWCGGGLAVVGVALAAMACASIAALLVPLRPRLYGASVALAAAMIALAAISHLTGN